MSDEYFIDGFPPPKLKKPPTLSQDYINKSMRARWDVDNAFNGVNLSNNYGELRVDCLIAIMVDCGLDLNDNQIYSLHGCLGRLITDVEKHRLVEAVKVLNDLGN